MNLSIEKCIFPDDWTTARVTSIFKAGEEENLGNYQQISVLLCFSKILEKVVYMYNRFYKHLTMTDILYEKQFGFQAFNYDRYTL